MLDSTINRERFAGLNFCIFHGFQEYCKSFFREYKCLSLIVLNIMTTHPLLMAKATQKYFRKNFDGAETANI